MVPFKPVGTGHAVSQLAQHQGILSGRKIFRPYGFSHPNRRESPESNDNFGLDPAATLCHRIRR